MKSNKKKLIVTADDFGYDEERNRGIVECFIEGAVTRASLLVNGVACANACYLAKRYSIPLGLHLNLTEGKPLSCREEIATLVTSDGYFLGKYGIREAMNNGCISLTEVAREISAQVSAFKILNGELPVFVDGHQHVHILPGISDVFAKLLVQFGITNTRLPLESALSECSWIPDVTMEFFKSVIKNAEEAENCFMLHKLLFADSFVGLSTMSNHMSSEHLQQRLMKCFRGSSCELMVHVGYRCQGDGGCGGPEGADDFARSADREHELRVIKSPEMAQFYIEQQFQMTYRIESASCVLTRLDAAKPILTTP